MTEKLLEVRNLSKIFAPRFRINPLKKDSSVRAVDNVSFDIDRGETLALVGESGCGKSTTGRLVLRLLDASEGQVTFDGQNVNALSSSELRKLRSQMQIVFQDPFGSLSPRRTVEQIIAEPMAAFGITRRAEQRERITTLLQQVGLSPDDMRKYPRQFSGGQRQRIGIARAIALGPSFVVADEPVSALDVSVQAQIVNLMQDIQKQHRMAYLFISHDLAIVRHIADRVAVMYLGRIIEIGPKATVFSAPQHPYTQALLSAAPAIDPKKRARRIVLTGDVPSPSAIPSGCSFRTRCPLAQPICAQEQPPLKTVAAGQLTACHFAEPHPIKIQSSPTPLTTA
ncbi:ABC transporter ATP-binding protein [Pelagibacterium montanilacus]|uniref:ABC transporter ATP-binding protein n=1 Tax=Pelagibacterium montanilacus TaxID=2185280 RepID=UPI000F8EA2B8|nr:dipeptide ABC transporter ATP-binding protein [Pelagibacterium montanilacus]